MKTPIWEGVYKNFQEVPVAGPGFSGSDWVEKSSQRITDLRSRTAEESSIPSVTTYTESLLPIVAAIVHGEKGEVKILDFGGGPGLSFYQVRESLSPAANLEFYVIDFDEVCAKGRSMFSGEPQIHFHSSLTDIQGENFDIVHIGSSLQYIDNWQQQLAELCRYGPEYFLMANIPAGDIQTYATAQYYYGSKIACWFFSVSDLCASMRENGYEAIFRSLYLLKIFGVEQPYPQDNFDEEFRVKHPCMLLFRKESK